MSRLAQDSGYQGPIEPDTKLFSDLGYSSLDFVILGTAIQDHYQRPMAFSKLMADMGERQISDISLSELVDFVAGELSADPSKS
jgi:acyl carrier protein